MKKQYTINDLTIKKTHQQKTEQGMIKHTHTVLFKRPLNLEEQKQFIQLVESIQKQVNPAQADDYNVTFITDNQATYTLVQADMSGLWKDLLLAELTIFSNKNVTIIEHDNSQFFGKVMINILGVSH